MFENIENLELLNVISGLSALRNKYVDRPSHVLIFKWNGESVYTFADRKIALPQGGILFIPQGSCYTVEKVSQGVSRYTLINFRANLPGALPELFHLQTNVDFTRIYAQLGRCRVMDTAADRYRALSLFYETLSLMGEKERPAYQSALTLEKLDPAVEYLRENLFDPALKVGTLHTLCGISDTYFRRLFIARFGVSPKKYILNQRLNQARAIIENGEFNSIREAALLTGFDDALYFSKVFKQKFGYAPSQHDRLDVL